MNCFNEKTPDDHDCLLMMIKKTFQNDYYLNEKLLMIPGPTNLNQKVLKSLSLPLLSHTDPQFYQVSYL